MTIVSEVLTGPKIDKYPLEILRPKNWEKLFPREQYKKFKAKNPSLTTQDKANVSLHALKYLIAMDEPDSSIIPYIKNLKAKNSPQISSNFTKHSLTALHIATMKGRKELVRELLEAGASSNSIDAYCWTPLHHAALSSAEIFNLLLSYQADRNALNRLAGTAQNLRQILGLEICQDKRPIFIQDKNGKFEISIEELKKRTGLRHYSDECVYAAHFLKSIWTSPPDEFDKTLSFHEQSQRTLRKIFQTMKMNPPSVILKEELFDNLPEYGLCAGRRMKCGEGLVEYTGKSIRPAKEIVPKSFSEALKVEKEAKYRLIQLDAAKYGNISRFINDGWPNVIVSGLLTERGLKTRNIFIISSPEGVKEGESILWDYGNYAFALKWGRYLIVEKKAIRAFFKAKPLTKYIHEINSSFSRACQTFSPVDVAVFYNSEQKLFHPLTTPAVLIDLTLSKTVKVKEWNRLFSIEESVKARLSNPVHVNWIKKLLSILTNFEMSLQNLFEIEGSQEFGNEICEALIKLQDQLSVVQTVKGLTEVNAAVSKLVGKKQLLELKQPLAEKLKNLGSYEWENDPDFPFKCNWDTLIEKV